jgi:hypothetical protein
MILQLIDENERSLVQYLLSETRQRVKMDGEYGNAFLTMIGVSQGDALSLLLFILYL